MKNNEDKIPADITNLATKTTLLGTNASLNGKTNEIKGWIRNITNLATTSGLPAVKNKIPKNLNI